MEMLLSVVALTVLTWLAYWGTIRNGFVSDDIEGLANWDGKVKKFNYGFINKWVFLKLFGKDPRANHVGSILLHNTAVILLYLFLSQHTTPTIALLASALFAVHPIGTQAVAWISGRGYPLGLIFLLLLLNFTSMYAPQTVDFANPLMVAKFAGFLLINAFLCYFAINAQFTTLAMCAILLFFGHWFLGLLTAGIVLFLGVGIIKETISLRAGTFKEQNLGESTYIKPQKIIVAFKSLAYYIYICFFPKRLGLYHTFYYNYSAAVEKEDKWFWLGFVEFLTLLGLFIFGSPIVKLAALWFVSYIFIFLNWITIHQFVSERYAYIANIGVCILLAVVLQYNLPLFCFVLALYLMRTMVHMPSYQDEVNFYQSNIWNFPDSEVAFANLGVVYMRCNLIGSALDMWTIALKINPNYDVAAYNIHSTLKQRGDLVKAKEYLEKAIKSEICHFKKQWGEELAVLVHEMEFAKEMNESYAKLAELEKDPSKITQATDLRNKLNALVNVKNGLEETRKNNLNLVMQDESMLSVKMVQIKKVKDDLSKEMPINEVINLRDNSFKLFKQELNKLLEVNCGHTSGGIQKG